METRRAGEETRRPRRGQVLGEGLGASEAPHALAHQGLPVTPGVRRQERDGFSPELLGLTPEGFSASGKTPLLLRPPRWGQPQETNAQDLGRRWRRS